MPDRRFTLVRHGRSDYNRLGLVNGDPSIAVSLDDVGVAQCERLAGALADQPFDLAVRTRFTRTGESLAILLDNRDVPVVVYPELDDVHLGDFESRPVEEYRAWRRANGPEVNPPGEGESRLGALYRYAAGFRRMLDEDAMLVLAVLHDVPILFLANAVRGEDPLDGPVTHVENASVLVLDGHAMRVGVGVMRDRLGL